MYMCVYMYLLPVDLFCGSILSANMDLVHGLFIIKFVTRFHARLLSWVKTTQKRIKPLKYEAESIIKQIVR